MCLMAENVSKTYVKAVYKEYIEAGRHFNAISLQYLADTIHTKGNITHGYPRGWSDRSIRELGDQVTFVVTPKNMDLYPNAKTGGK